MIVELVKKVIGQHQTHNISLEGNVEVSFESRDLEWNTHLKELRNFKAFNEHYEFDANQYLPPDWSLRLFDSPYKSCSTDFEYKEITIKPIKSIENLFSLFHEFGHLENYFQSSQKMHEDRERVHNQIYFNPNKRSRLHAVREYMSEEYSAWDFSFCISENFEFDPNVNEMLLRSSERSLLTHIDKFNGLDGGPYKGREVYEFRDVLIGDLKSWTKKYADGFS